MSDKLSPKARDILMQIFQGTNELPGKMLSQFTGGVSGQLSKGVSDIYNALTNAPGPSNPSDPRNNGMPTIGTPPNSSTPVPDDTTLPLLAGAGVLGAIPIGPEKAAASKVPAISEELMNMLALKGGGSPLARDITTLGPNVAKEMAAETPWNFRPDTPIPNESNSGIAGKIQQALAGPVGINDTIVNKAPNPSGLDTKMLEEALANTSIKRRGVVRQPDTLIESNAGKTRVEPSDLTSIEEPTQAPVLTKTRMLPTGNTPTVKVPASKFTPGQSAALGAMGTGSMLAGMLLAKMTGKPTTTPVDIPPQPTARQLPMATKSGMKNPTSPKIPNRKGANPNIQTKPFDPFAGTEIDYNNFSDMLRKRIMSAKP